MRSFCLLLVLSALSIHVYSQSSFARSDTWGIVLDHPDTKKVSVQQNIVFTAIDGRELHLDVYSPPGIGKQEKRATIVLLNGIGDRPDESPMRSSEQQTSWARLLAANGFAVVTMESQPSKQQETFIAVFNFLSQKGDQYHVNKDNIGVQSFSAHGAETIKYLMGKNIFAGIKAAVMFYPPGEGGLQAGPYREDLPVYAIIAELDSHGGNYVRLWQDVMKNGAPWTIAVAKDMPHGFDINSDTETARRMIMSAVSFLKEQLLPVSKPVLPFAKEREIIAATYSPDKTRALELLDQWMKDHPGTTDAHALGMYGNLLMDADKFAEAEEYIARAISANPSNKGSYLTLAVICYAQGKTKEGADNIALYEKGADPESFTYWYIANRIIGRGKYKDASMLYERAITFNDARPFVYYNLGLCYAKLGDKDKAFLNLFKAAEQKFKTKDAYEADEYLASLRQDQRWSSLMSKLEE